MKNNADLWNNAAIKIPTKNQSNFLFFINEKRNSVTVTAIVCLTPERVKSKKPNVTKNKIAKKGSLAF